MGSVPGQCKKAHAHPQDRRGRLCTSPVRRGSRFMATHRPHQTTRRCANTAGSGSRSIAAMNRHTRGFTLLELMTTLLVLSILHGLAIPSFRATIENNRVTAATNDFVSSLNFARSEAL